MPQVNLTALTGQELRHLLDSSRARGDARSAYEILREMAARREAAAERRPAASRRAAAPRLVSVDLGDPLEAKEDDLPPLPNWRAPAHDDAPPAAAASEPVEAEAVEAEPPPPVADAPAPLVLRATDPEPSAPPPADDVGLRLHSDELPSLRPRARGGLRVAAGFAVGITAGLALGWWTASQVPNAPWRPAAPIQPAAQVAKAPPTPAILDVAVAEPPPLDVVPDPAIAPPPQVAEVPTASAETAEADGAPTEQPVETAELAAPPPERAPAAVAAADTCAAAPTPADREICADPALQRLQRELRQAYADALDAHADRATLRQRQLAWREARNTVSDPTRLARLYEQRIHKLQAAAAEARAQR
jgi:hypothetical protein